MPQTKQNPSVGDFVCVPDPQTGVTLTLQVQDAWGTGYVGEAAGKRIEVRYVEG